MIQKRKNMWARPRPSARMRVQRRHAEDAPAGHLVGITWIHPPTPSEHEQATHDRQQSRCLVPPAYACPDAPPIDSEPVSPTNHGRAAREPRTRSPRRPPPATALQLAVSRHVMDV